MSNPMRRKAEDTILTALHATGLGPVELMDILADAYMEMQDTASKAGMDSRRAARTHAGNFTYRLFIANGQDYDNE